MEHDSNSDLVLYKLILDRLMEGNEISIAYIQREYSRGFVKANILL